MRQTNRRYRMATKVVSYGKHRLMHRVHSTAGRFAVADVLAFGSEKVTFDQLVDALGSDELIDDAVVVAEYEYWDKDSLIKKLHELRAGYIAFASAVLEKKED
jgi:hypothetical protein